MPFFGQVWLWSLAGFLVGALLCWLLIANPARKRVAELERSLADDREPRYGTRESATALVPGFTGGAHDDRPPTRFGDDFERPDHRDDRDHLDRDEHRDGTARFEDRFGGDHGRDHDHDRDDRDDRDRHDGDEDRDRDDYDRHDDRHDDDRHDDDRHDGRDDEREDATQRGALDLGGYDRRDTEPEPGELFLPSQGEVAGASETTQYIRPVSAEGLDRADDRGDLYDEDDRDDRDDTVGVDGHDGQVDDESDDRDREDGDGSTPRHWFGRTGGGRLPDENLVDDIDEHDGHDGHSDHDPHPVGLRDEDDDRPGHRHTLDAAGLDSDDSRDSHDSHDTDDDPVRGGSDLGRADLGRADLGDEDDDRDEFGTIFTQRTRPIPAELIRGLDERPRADDPALVDDLDDLDDDRARDRDRDFHDRDLDDRDRDDRDRDDRDGRDHLDDGDDRPRSGALAAMDTATRFVHPVPADAHTYDAPEPEEHVADTEEPVHREPVRARAGTSSTVRQEATGFPLREESPVAFGPAEPARTASALPKRVPSKPGNRFPFGVQTTPAPSAPEPEPAPVTAALDTAVADAPVPERERSLFEPIVPVDEAPPAEPKPPTPPRPRGARTLSQTATGVDPFVPIGPFGPGSAMPLPGGRSPSSDYTIKASVTALRYCPPESPKFDRTVAEVWFRSVAEAERVGFRPLP